jgi:HEAT repeat protein
MMTHGVLLVVAAFQLGLIVGILWLVVITNGRMRARDSMEARAPLLLRQPLTDFLVRRKGVEALALELARMPRVTASRQMERLGASIIAREQLLVLAARVRNDPWVTKTLAGGESRHWWKRLDAARLLVMVYQPGDRALFARLVTDEHPAVAAAASAGIAAHADPELVHTIVRRLSSTPPTLQMQQMLGLRHHSEIVTRLVVDALARPLAPAELQAMVHLAEIVATPAALSGAVRLAAHHSPEVRAAVARALRAAFVPGAPEAARKLLHDSDWQVRAAAARAVEGLRVTNAIPELRESLRDEKWWVRFRAAGALAALGEPGSIALEEAIVSDDAYASQMAIAIGGLSEANRLDIGG